MPTTLDSAPPSRNLVSITPKSPSDETFTVLCYNILCEQYAFPTLYPYTPLNVLDWKYRRQRILEEIVHYHCDFVCLQEVDWAAFENFFVRELGREGYEGVYCPAWAKRLGLESIRPTDGCAVLFRRDRYRLLEKNIIEYTDLAKRLDGFQSSKHVGDRLLSRANIAILCLFERLDTGKHILLVNTHIFWDPNFKDVKVVQVRLLTEEIEKMRNMDSSSTPVVLCGDFNSLPDSGVYDFLSSGSLSGQHPDFMNYSYGRFTSEGMKHDLCLSSAYSTAQSGGTPKELLPWTNYTGHFKGVLDYIWYSSGNLKVNTILGGVDGDYIEKEKVIGFPNTHFPSDHIAIMAEFSMKST